MSTNNNGSSTLSSDGSNNARLTERVSKLLNLDVISATGSDDRLDLSKQPLSRLLAVGGLVVSILEFDELCQSAAQVCLAQLRNESIDGRCLSNSAREAGEELKAEAGLIKVGNIDEGFVFL